ncbi:MAG: peptidoglycan endopeptidase [Burkholderiaceae bacterium]|uniref:Peptidoglycan endopeptidase n=1 Tax=Cupriavidus metallidurans TaxID=119219 RepID=A0A482IQJ0_9BURK|nr:MULTISPECIES: C40 family peptidase [Cupriavidus]KWR81988.1 peptidase P60 [Cupriavidus sp. SHE]PCH58226.1 MAG: peptidoglycan endopeptidase [Burkholderiaceae bacterium]QBP10182.1 peptidoglycan endopeptidase [Cupriavidus metallidurans]
MPQRPFHSPSRRLSLSALCAAALLLAACAGGPPARQGASLPRTPGKPIVDPSAGLEEVSIQAMSLVGTPYRYGGNTPDSGFDCSGLVRYVVQRAASVNLPRTTEQMGQRGTALDRRDVASGDLVFFNTTGRANSHVGIYVGQNRFVHAPATGGTVRLEDMTKSYWASRYNGARRVVAAGSLDMTPVPSPVPSAPVTPVTPLAPLAPDDDDPIAAFANR